MTAKRAAKVLVRQSELAERLGLPAGTTVHRLELDTTELDPILELTVTGPACPLSHGALQRMPLEDVAATRVCAAINGTMIVQAADFIREGALVTAGSDGGIVEWIESTVGKPIGHALESARRGDSVRVAGLGVADPR